MHRDGRAECLHRLDEADQGRIQAVPNSRLSALPRMGIHEPRPLRERPREPVIPDRVDWAAGTGRLLLADAGFGRNMAGVRPGEIRSVLVLEIPPKPFGHGGEGDACLENYSSGRIWRFLKRVVGEFPVEADGSAYAEVPARRALQLIALDAQGRSVKRMNSFISVMPGETVSCVGCHEQRTQTGPAYGNLAALRRGPVKVKAIPGVPDCMDYPRDVQPVLDRHCTGCHNAEKMAGRLDLSGEHGGFRSFSWMGLTQEKYMPYVWTPFIRETQMSDLPPRSFGSGAWGAMPYFEGRAKGHEKIRLDPNELRLVQVWADLPAQYRGSYFTAGASCDAIRYNRWQDTPLDGRCLDCHRTPAERAGKTSVAFFLPRFAPSDHRWVGTRIVNLCRPELSVVLRAPLAKDAGGLGWCRDKQNKPVFAGKQDADYQRLLAFINKQAAGKPMGKDVLPWHKMKFYDVPIAPGADIFRLQEQTGQRGDIRRDEGPPLP
jgi:hypothetical protein